MKCPKCGYVRQNRDNVFAPPTECPACGVVYAKHLTTTTESMPVEGLTGTKKSSPVHEETLKQARERVERRLRKKFYPVEKDELREQTLQRAKMFVTEGIKKRREEAQLGKGTDQAEAQAAPQEAQQELLPEAVDEAAPASSNLAAELERMFEAEPEAESSAAAKDEMDVIHTDAPQTDAPVVLSLDQENIEEAQAPAPVEPAEAAVSEAEPEPAFQMGAEEAPPVSEAEPVSVEAAAEAEPASSETPSSVYSAATIAAISASNQQAARSAGSSLMRLLPLAAWLILVAGVVGAILSWTTLNDVQAGISSADTTMANRLPVALLLGFAYLATGVLGFAFFWVSAMINTQIKEIRLLLLQSASQESDEAEGGVE
ncbi:MAG: hypothetical protein M0036_27075 [Desulfobacteraceae bacterium]|nr:hypothetical protein [Desulfobacteraceae bacterium]